MSKQTYRVPIAKEAEVDALLRLGFISIKGPVTFEDGTEWVECVAEDAETAEKLKNLEGVLVAPSERRS